MKSRQLARSWSSRERIDLKIIFGSRHGTALVRLAGTVLFKALELNLPAISQEHLTYSLYEFKCPENVKYTPDFKDF